MSRPSWWLDMERRGAITTRCPGCGDQMVAFPDWKGGLRDRWGRPWHPGCSRLVSASRRLRVFDPNELRRVHEESARICGLSRVDPEDVLRAVVDAANQERRR